MKKHVIAMTGSYGQKQSTRKGRTQQRQSDMALNKVMPVLADCFVDLDADYNQYFIKLLAMTSLTDQQTNRPTD